jgi:hypothetical protein
LVSLWGVPGSQEWDRTRVLGPAVNQGRWPGFFPEWEFQAIWPDLGNGIWFLGPAVGKRDLV